MNVLNLDAPLIFFRQGTILDKQQWMKFLDAARASRYAKVFATELLCNYGTVKDTLGLVSCSCATVDGICNDETLASLHGSNVAYFR